MYVLMYVSTYVRTHVCMHMCIFIIIIITLFYIEPCFRIQVCSKVLKIQRCKTHNHYNTKTILQNIKCIIIVIATILSSFISK